MVLVWKQNVEQSGLHKCQNLDDFLDDILVLVIHSGLAMHLSVVNVGFIVEFARSFMGQTSFVMFSFVGTLVMNQS